ncbi:MAG: hypothetical protein UY31_C0070G0005 [Candidatus Wolfebacteria bacterium GW2011_GWE1_48_7]|nr:MAG: hypothetical protein UX49_C0047G0004 [Candidatus Wolfebacteria bacterium GW2011_GWC2_46_275]KKU41485.1 MAG: hypothetical protein UX58_C0008G0051 [Candidatus Wolfebacteria bacterium GW2011_GWB2_46_69]KKU53575.1 MAG: hypothetical protein UX76_C0013G0003 [Candidatus Wolfebacteria bacterium GW2011_GWC1_47_103]KKU58806.1 MAG: hypothetical protein UX83_C0011G0018 [Candidatus Wolfebacteria bacterium GW2011_GWE2_47_12]KKU65439.1 MAG: hypothetical protein UX90_C0005G0003 [Candidatus Wolfebacteri
MLIRNRIRVLEIVCEPFRYGIGRNGEDNLEHTLFDKTLGWRVTGNTLPHLQETWPFGNGGEDSGEYLAHSLFNEMIRNGFAGYMLPNAHKRVPIIDMRKDVGECFAYAPLNEECDRSSKGLLVEFDEVVEVGDSGKYLCHAPLDESACMGADCA